MYKENTKKVSWIEGPEKIEKKWQKIKNIIDKVLIKKEIRKKNKEKGAGREKLVGQELHKREKKGKKNPRKNVRKERRIERPT